MLSLFCCLCCFGIYQILHFLLLWQAAAVPDLYMPC